MKYVKICSCVVNPCAGDVLGMVHGKAHLAEQVDCGARRVVVVRVVNQRWIEVVDESSLYATFEKAIAAMAGMEDVECAES